MEEAAAQEPARPRGPYTVTEAARLVGISPQAVRERCQRGTVATVSILRRGRRVLGIEHAELVRHYGPGKVGKAWEGRLAGPPRGSQGAEDGAPGEAVAMTLRESLAAARARCEALEEHLGDLRAQLKAAHSETLGLIARRDQDRLQLAEVAGEVPKPAARWPVGVAVGLLVAAGAEAGLLWATIGDAREARAAEAQVGQRLEGERQERLQAEAARAQAEAQLERLRREGAAQVVAWAALRSLPTALRR